MHEDSIETEWADVELARAITMGTLIGIPFTFLLMAVLSVVADLSWWKAAGVALMPAVFVGPYIGGLFAVGAVASRHETPRATAEPAPTEDTHRLAA